MNALFLHQSAHEVKIGFSILYAVFAYGVRARERQTVVGSRQTGVGEHFFEDIRDREVLKDARVMAMPQAPEFRCDAHVIDADALAIFDVTKTADDAIYMAR